MSTTHAPLKLHKAEGPQHRLPTQRGQILIVDDDPIIAESLADMLSEQGHTVMVAGDGREALHILRQHPGIALAICDMHLPAMSGPELIDEIRTQHESVSIVVITGYGTIESAVQAVKAGAMDYLTKPIVDDELLFIVEKAMRQHVLMRENVNMKNQLAQRYGVGNIVGADHRMQKVYDLIESVADSRTTVLVTGESGTGKSMVARAIHQASQRQRNPFVTMACGSIPETLLESELFGHMKGAFTGATHDKPGKLAAANTGTLFIDEINSATATLQLKLLRVLQEKQFEPVGSQDTVKVDVRFVLATNQALEPLVRDQAFREDLYYRINVVKVELPALRDRPKDIGLLAEHFMAKFCDETGKMITGMTEDAMAALRSYRWPGNVRELENAIEHAVVLSKKPTLDRDDLPEPIAYQQDDGQPGFKERRKNPGTWPGENWQPRPLRDAIQEPEKQILLATLKACDWNRQETAKLLDINRTTLYKKIKQYGLEELAAE